MLRHVTWIISVSEGLRALSRGLPFLTSFADSIYVSATKLAAAPVPAASESLRRGGAGAASSCASFHRSAAWLDVDHVRRYRRLESCGLIDSRPGTIAIAAKRAQENRVGRDSKTELDSQDRSGAVSEIRSDRIFL